MKARQWLDAFQLVHLKKKGARKVNEMYDKPDKPERCIVLRVRDYNRLQRKLAKVIAVEANFSPQLITKFEMDMAAVVLEALGFPKRK